MDARAADRTRARPTALGDATVGSLQVLHLAFPPSFQHGVVDPPRGYVAIGLEGAVCKHFTRNTATLARGTVMSIPSGAAHASAFGRDGFQVLLLRATDDRGARLFGSLLRRRASISAAATSVLAWQLAAELRCRDRSSELAVEGLALELLARLGRALPGGERGVQPWVADARELLEASAPRLLTLQQIGAAVDRHPAHVARAFRRAYGVGTAEYARWLRLEWATRAVVSSDDPLARIALDAGFADQSHFTRCFRRHHGVTPARYREVVRS